MHTRSRVFEETRAVRRCLLVIALSVMLALAAASAVGAREDGNHAEGHGAERPPWRLVGAAGSAVLVGGAAVIWRRSSKSG